MGIIYKATFPNGKCYIGMTIRNLDERRIDHEKSAQKGSLQLFHVAMRENNLNDIIWEIIEEIDDIEKLKVAEKKYIFEFKSYRENGYNNNRGGISPCLQDNWSEILKKSWESEDRKQQASKRMKERWENEEFKKNMSEQISKRLKDAWKEERFDKCTIKIACDAAAIKNRKSKWYNNGVNEFRLLPECANSSVYFGRIKK